MDGFNDPEAGDKLDVTVEDGHLVAEAFDYTEEVGIPIMESQFVNLDAETEEFDIPHFVGDLRALMVDDSEDYIVLDSDDEVISEKKEGKIGGHLWRRASAVGSHSFEARSSAGSNSTEKVTTNDPSAVHADTCYQEVITGKSSDRNLILNNENAARVDLNRYGKQCIDKSSEGGDFVILKAHSNDIENANGTFNESPEPGELSQANALSFVDHFLSVSVVNLSPDIRIPKVDGLRSPLASCARGAQNLAKKANLLSRIGISTFDWDGTQPGPGGEFVSRNKKELDSQREKHLDEGFEDIVKEADYSKRRYSRTDCVNKSDEHFETEFVSFDTQMAAEAIESLLHAPPPEQLKNSHDLKVVTQKKQKKDSDSEKENMQDGGYRKRESREQMHQKVKAFSPVAFQTRHASSVRCSKRNGETCNLGYITHCKEVNILNKRKTGDLDPKFLSGKRMKCPGLETTFCHLKFDTWKWPKKKRTHRNKRQTVTIKFGSDNENSFVGPGETSGNIMEAFWVAGVKRKARSVSKLRPIPGNKLIQKSSQPSLADVTNTKCVSVSTSLGGEQKMKGPLSKKQIIKRNSTSPSLRNELSRLGFAESFPDFISKDMRRRRSMVEIRVLFSQNLDDEVVKQQRKIMTKLGACIAKDCSDATHIVADRFARTKKILEAMAFGKPVVTPLWLESCKQARCVIDEKLYILRDAKKEKEIGFSMPVSLSRARANPLLKDRRVIITPNVEPNREIIKKLVKAVHGQVMEGIRQASMEYNISDNLLILSCEHDYETCVPFLDKGAAVYSSELLLNGIIIQKLEYTRHQLFTRHVKMLRYTRKRRKNGS